MANDRIIPNAESSDLPTFTIYSGGTELSGVYQVAGFYSLKQVNKISMAKIVILDGDAASEDFPISNSEDLIPGKDIEIHAGYHNEEELVYKGIIIKHGIKIRKDKPSLLEIEARDVGVKLTIGRKNKFFYESTDSDNIELILGDYSDLTSDIESTTVQYPEQVQYNTTDWDYIVTRSEANGMLVFLNDGEIAIKKPKISEPVLSLIYGSTILEFESYMDARNQLASILTKSWDYASQEIIEGEAEDPSIEEQGNFSASDLAEVIGLSNYDMVHSGALPDEEIGEWANAGMVKSRLSKIRGRVSFQGFSAINPGETIELSGVGERFSGKAFVAAVSHQLNANNWVTNVEFGISPEWFSKQQNDIQSPMAGGIIPPIQGLHIGVVTQIHEDPNGEHRVLVKIPIISTEEDGIWARYTTPDAGENRGIYFKPEVSDEVVVGFLNNDPRNPIILGSMHSSALASPIEDAEENNEKGIITRGELKLLFDDDTNNILLSTPNGNEILLSEDAGAITIVDENDNKIELSSSGILIESASDVNIKASGDVNIEGTNISMAATSQLTAEGSSGAELSSSGQAVVKGSLVQIN